MICDYCNTYFNEEEVGLVCDTGHFNTIRINGLENVKLGPEAMSFCTLDCFNLSIDKYEDRYDCHDCPLVRL